MKRNDFNADLDAFDWNFDAVPDGELIACCYWEYARESVFIRDVRRRCGDGKWKDMLPLEAWSYVGKEVEQLQSIGYHAEVFLRGFFFNGQEDKRPEHPDAPRITGSYPNAWQSLSGDERSSRARIRTHVEQFDVVPIKLAHWAWAKEIARACQQTADERHEKRKAWERKHLGRDKAGNLSMSPKATVAPEFTELRAGIRWGCAETLMVDIAWECFTNDEISTYFRKWVKHVRPKDVPKPDDKGHKPGDWRAKLTKLAVMRLLARFTPLEIVDTRRNKFPAVWKTKQFAGRKWADPTKWHDARREAGQFFRKLFPFLTKEEKPLSWNRQRPGK